MESAASFVLQSTAALLRLRQNVVVFASKHRAKFENWLKFELAAYLDAHTRANNVVPEGAYSDGDRCDIVCQIDDAMYFLELKTCNTSWRAKGTKPKTCPITQNVTGVIQDIEKLQTAGPDARGLAVFLFFPAPGAKWKDETSELHDQLARIEREADMRTGSLLSNGEFVATTSEYGLAVFVAEVSSSPR